MKALVLEKKIEMDLYKIVRFQINLYCFLNDIRISPAQLDTLAFLGLWGEINFSDFCEQIVEEELFSNPQTTRNFILKCVREGMVVRKGKGKKLIDLSDKFELLNEGTIVIDMKVYHVDKSKESNS
jgi:hypothetical protein